jgi:DNA-binding MarR family transcriptional regulator
MMGSSMRGVRSLEATRLISEILDVADRLRKRLNAPCDEHDVGGSRFALLATICQAGEEGCSQTELAARLGLSESNVSALVESLRKAGLLFRLRSRTDRRRSILLLREPGQELVTLLTEARESAAEALLQRIPAPQIAELRRLLNELGTSLAEAEGPPPVAPSRQRHTETLRRAS